MNKKEQKQKPVKQIPKKKLFWFRLAGVMMPFLFLLLLELVLRLFHYGYNTDLFIEYPGNKDYLVMNPDASRKYFSDQAIATTGNTEPFKKEKDDNTLRIFVLGESTTIGYPYFHNASFHRWLQYRIDRGLPDKNLEIINCALTAVNSYTVLGFAKQVVNYQPDAVLIYVGHNEYYGALGVGSTDRLGGNPLMIGILLRLRQLRIAQLVANTWQGLIRLFRTKQSFSGKTRMELMVGEQKIAYESNLFNRGIEQFRMNMDATLSYLNRYHIPVYVSNLVSNEKDLKPFVSAMPDTLTVPQFAENFRAGETAWQSAKYDTALEYLNRAAKWYSGHARCNYYLGWLANHAGDSVAASRYFSKALDLDELRFRAPHQLNEIIAALCRKYPNTHLVDTRSEFERWSAHHIIGDELILEHVHPNLMGYALMADAFYQALKQGGLITIPRGEELSFEACLQEMPITAVDSLTGAIRINRLRSSWPFSEVQRPATDSVVARTEERKLAEEIIDKELGWSQAMEELYAYSIGQHDLSKA
ncbi:MAG TPA: hypothetical protein VG890_03435, partial [Puia sp.]|nr:hypothetical protein [Puia sp.]